MPFVSLSCTHDELMKPLSLLGGPQAGQFRAAALQIKCGGGIRVFAQGAW